MRLKYYKISLRQMGIKKPFVLFLFLFIIFLILFCIISYVKRISPIIKDMCESNANAVSVKIVNNSVYDYISDKEKIAYADFKILFNAALKLLFQDKKIVAIINYFS